MSSGCQGPVSSSPGFVSGCASLGMGTSSLRRQRHWLSRPRKLSIIPWTIWPKVQSFPLTGSSNFSFQFGQAYFFLTGEGDARSAWRALKAAAISGRSSRVSDSIVFSTLTSRPFTFFVPKRSGKSCKTSSRIINLLHIYDTSAQRRDAPGSRRFWALIWGAPRLKAILKASEVAFSLRRSHRNNPVQPEPQFLLERRLLFCGRPLKVAGAFFHRQHPSKLSQGRG